MPEKSVPAPFGALPANFLRGPEKSKNCANFAYFPWWASGPYSPGVGSCAGVIQPASRSPPGQVWKPFSTTLAPFLSRLSLLGVTLGGLEMQLSGPKTDFGAQGAP